jgi:3-phosphoglycerate kinase
MGLKLSKSYYHPANSRILNNIFLYIHTNSFLTMKYNLNPVQEAELKDKKVIMRVDYDVVKDGKIKDDDRLEKSLPTIKFIIESGAKQIILIAHNGKPKGENIPSLSLKPIKPWLDKHLPEEVGFIDDCMKGTLPDAPKVLLLENLRFYGEEKVNNPDFAKKLASYGDIYVGNAFATAHREHASMMIPTHCDIPSYAGLILQREVEMLSKVTDSCDHPFHAIVGFAKIGDKIQVLENLLSKTDKLLIGGAVVFTFYKSMGKEVGNSLVDDDHLDTAKALLDKYGDKIVLPEDIVIADSIKGENPTTVAWDAIPADKIGLDLGAQTVAKYIQTLEDAKTVFWNGPVGVFEVKPFDEATNKIAQYLARTDKTTIIGGGDTTKAMKNAGVYEKLTHVSTGGGASLEFIQGKDLPGLRVLCR